MFNWEDTLYCVSDTHFTNFFDKQINLGLDLQGGSYLLLEIDNNPVIIQRLQNTVSILRKYFKDESVRYNQLWLENNKTIIFKVDTNQIEKVKKIFEDKNSELNPYYPQYKSHQFNLEVINNLFKLNYSKYGLIEIKNSVLSQYIILASFTTCA